jgi:plasmid stabilization system protein ParE
MKLIWTEQAERSYIQQLLYLEEHWGPSIVERFVRLSLDYLGTIERNPELFPLSSVTNVRRCLVHSTVSLYYAIDSDTIVLLTFFDNRQDPSQLGELLRQ